MGLAQAFLREFDDEMAAARRCPTTAPTAHRSVCRAILLGMVAISIVPRFAHGQRLTARDSALVARVLLAEDRRDSLAPALEAAARHRDPRVVRLAERARARIREPLFTSRAAFPTDPPPTYPDPAWRLRYRALATASCAGLRTALADSAWAVRLRAVDLIPAACRQDTNVVPTLAEWARRDATRAARGAGDVSWHPAAHAVLALARLAPDSARAPLAALARTPVSFARVYAARAARELRDTVLLARLTADRSDNVKEAAIEGLAATVGHDADDRYLAALGASGYQAVRAAARALAGTPHAAEAVAAAARAARRLRRDSSETSRDARLALVALLASVNDAGRAPVLARLATDFDCAVADSAAALLGRIAPGRATGAARCRPLPIALPPGAVALALGDSARIRVTMADSSGGGRFVVKLRGDAAPITAARVLALVRRHYYDGLTWHRVEPDFVIQGGSRGDNEYAGYPRFVRDELGTVPHARGTVGMSTRGHDTGDMQWFVNLRDNLRLGRDYTVFGEVVDGIDVVDGVLEGDVIARMDVLRDGR